MTQFLMPTLQCDFNEGDCGRTATDWFEMQADSVDGEKVTEMRRAPGWTSNAKGDFCPEHRPPEADQEHQA